MLSALIVIVGLEFPKPTLVKPVPMEKVEIVSGFRNFHETRSILASECQDLSCLMTWMPKKYGSRARRVFMVTGKDRAGKVILELVFLRTYRNDVDQNLEVAFFNALIFPVKLDMVKGTVTRRMVDKVSKPGTGGWRASMITWDGSRTDSPVFLKKLFASFGPS